MNLKRSLASFTPFGYRLELQGTQKFQSNKNQLTVVKTTGQMKFDKTETDRFLRKRETAVTIRFVCYCQKV